MSDPTDRFPVHFTLTWNAVVSVGEVRIVFDTGLHRHLTLSHHDGYTARMEWGAAQPETIRDYAIEINTASGWKVLEQVRGNYQRLRVHRFENERGRAIRIVVLATNGLDHARILEVRVYE